MFSSSTACSRAHPIVLIFLPRCRVHVPTAACLRVSWVVLPQLFLASATNYLDRTALSFASLQMNADLQLSTQQYGLAAATFALGVCLSLTVAFDVQLGSC